LSVPIGLPPSAHAAISTRLATINSPLTWPAARTGVHPRFLLTSLYSLPLLLLRLRRHHPLEKSVRFPRMHRFLRNQAMTEARSEVLNRCVGACATVVFNPGQCPMSANLRIPSGCPSSGYSLETQRMRTNLLPFHKKSQVCQPPIMPTLFESRKPKACRREKQ